MRSENLYWIWLSECLGAGNSQMVELIEAFGSPFEIYNTTEEELVRSGCVTEKLANKLSNKNLSKAYKIVDFCVAGNIGILSYSDKFYPSRLKTLKDPPCVLYYKGTVPDFDNKVCVAVVGTRKMSEYGKRAAYKISYELASASAVVVSGMALGIDAVAACGAVSAGGKTVAVLGCGIDIVYPSQHKKLMEIIANNGAVITEFAPGTRPFGANFPIRNRIISGLCQGTLIVEADERSGAMITAKCALMQGRDIYALPGNIDESTAQGTNALIRDGASAVLEARDILDNYTFLYGKSINYGALVYQQERYAYDETIFDKMGISARYAKGKKPDTVKREYKASELRPFKKPELAERDDMPTTNEKNTNLKNEFAIKNEQKINSEELIATLGEVEKVIFTEMPIDRAASIDSLCALGYTVGEVMSALTLLEIKGLVSPLPGGIYIKR